MKFFVFFFLFFYWSLILFFTSCSNLIFNNFVRIGDVSSLVAFGICWNIFFPAYIHFIVILLKLSQTESQIKEEKR